MNTTFFVRRTNFYYNYQNYKLYYNEKNYSKLKMVRHAIDYDSLHGRMGRK